MIYENYRQNKYDENGDYILHMYDYYGNEVTINIPAGEMAENLDAMDRESRNKDDNFEHLLDKPTEKMKERRDDPNDDYDGDPIEDAYERMRKTENKNDKKERLKELIREIVKELPARQQDVYSSFYGPDMEFQASIARRYGKSRSTICRDINRISEAVGKILLERFSIDQAFIEEIYSSSNEED